MCGIAGYSTTRPSGDGCGLPAMVDALAHRGPDGCGLSADQGVGLGATRLSLLDSEHGAQPMVDGDLAVVFNGEVYNERELRADLQREGVRFAGRCDTEVLLHGFRRWGVALFERIEGMFALAVRAGRTLHLARDPFGIKPLVLWTAPDARTMLFASEVKALLRSPLVERHLDGAGLVEQIVFGHTLGTATLLRNVRHLPPGARVTVQPHGGRLRIEVSEAPVLRRLARPRSREHAVDRLGELLRESVARRLHADHPVATYLSGGLDSTLLAALRPDRAGSRSFVVADDAAAADVRHARRAARALGLDHGELIVTSSPPLRWLADAVLAAEGPAPPSVALLSAPAVLGAGKAALCGEGSDELFAGYGAHGEPEPLVRGFAVRLDALRAASVGAAPLATTTERIAALRARRQRERARAMYDFLLHERMPNRHLAIWDRGAMAASLEVRLPFLDRAIRDLALSLPAAWRSPPKAVVQALAARVLPPRVGERLRTRTKSAAPDALRATRHRLHARAAGVIPSPVLAAHPLRAVSGSPAFLVTIDVFLLAFVAGPGRLPEGFAVETMYARHGSELRAAHEAARAALFGG